MRGWLRRKRVSPASQNAPRGQAALTVTQAADTVRRKLTGGGMLGSRCGVVDPRIVMAHRPAESGQQGIAGALLGFVIALMRVALAVLAPRWSARRCGGAGAVGAGAARPRCVVDQGFGAGGRRCACSVAAGALAGAAAGQPAAAGPGFARGGLDRDRRPCAARRPGRRPAGWRVPAGLVAAGAGTGRAAAGGRGRNGNRGGGAVLRLRLEPASPEAFAAKAALPEPPDWALPRTPPTCPRRSRARTADLVVVLDPGHGGIDPGAERDGETEADLMLTFARELKEALLRGGRLSGGADARGGCLRAAGDPHLHRAGGGGGRVPVAARRCAGRGRGGGGHDLHPGR